MGNQQARYGAYDSDDLSPSYDSDDSDSDMGIYGRVNDVSSYDVEPARKIRKTADSGDIEIDPPPPGANALMPFLTPELIRKYTSAATFEEAYNASVEGSVSLSDNFISFENRTLKYKARNAGVSATVFLRATGGIERATCECRAGGPLWCRHIVSALLIVLYKAETIVRMDAIDKALETADKHVLKDLLLQHCESHPEFAVLLTRNLKDTFPEIFKLQNDLSAIPAESTEGLGPDENNQARKKLILKPVLQRTSMKRGNVADASSEPRPTDWRPAFLKDSATFLDTADAAPKLDTSRFGDLMRTFMSNNSTRGSGGLCPMYCYTFQVNGNCGHAVSPGSKITASSEMVELMDAVDTLWQHGDVYNAIDAMIKMTASLTSQMDRFQPDSHQRPLGITAVASLVGEKWCKFILSCPKEILISRKVKETIDEYYRVACRAGPESSQKIFEAARICFDNHWSDAALAKLLDIAFGKDVALEDPDAMEVEVAPAPPVPAAKQSRSKKRKRANSTDAAETAAAKVQKAVSRKFQEPLVAVAARLQYFAEVGNRTAWNALARWVISSINDSKPSMQDCKIIADALVAHSALGALAFLAGPVRKHTAEDKTPSDILSTNEVSEICDLLVSVAGKCCTPELKERRSAPLSSLVSRCATLVAPHLWDSLEDSDQVTNLLDYPPEITDLVTLELAIQGISSLASNASFSTSAMVWKLLGRIETECDVIAASAVALAAFPHSVCSSTERSTLPTELRGKTPTQWNRECCFTLIDYAYTKLPQSKRRESLVRAVDLIVASDQLSVAELQHVFSRLREYMRIAAEQPVAVPVPPVPASPSPAAKPVGKKSNGKESKKVADLTNETLAEQKPLSMEHTLSELVWRVGKVALTRNAPVASQSPYGGYYDTEDSGETMKQNLYNSLMGFIRGLPKIRATQSSILPADETAARREIGAMLLQTKCEDIADVLQSIASELPGNEPATIMMAARGFEVGAKASKSSERPGRYVSQLAMENQESKSKKAQDSALSWLNKALKLPQGSRDPDLIVSLLRAVYSAIPSLEYFTKIEELVFTPAVINTLGLTQDHIKSVRTHLIEVLRDSLVAGNTMRSERAAFLCVHLGLLPDSVAPSSVLTVTEYGATMSTKPDLVPILPGLIEHIADRGKNTYWFDLLIERVSSDSGSGQAHRLLTAARILSDKGRFDLAVKINGDAILAFARHISSSATDYTKLVNLVNEYKNVCLEANMVEKFQSTYLQIVSMPSVVRKPKLMGMMTQFSNVGKQGGNAKAKTALDKSIQKAKTNVMKTKICGSCLGNIENPGNQCVVQCPSCKKDNCMLLD